MTTPTIDSGYVADFMELVLEKVVDTFHQAGIGLPDRQYITFGTPAADWEQLTVSLQQLYLGTPGTPPTQPVQCNQPTTAILRVELLRKAPIPQDRKLMIPAETLNDTGTATVTDAEVLLRSVSAMCGATWGNMGVFADVTLPSEAGALSGPIMTLTIGVA